MNHYYYHYYQQSLDKSPWRGRGYCRSVVARVRMGLILFGLCVACCMATTTVYAQAPKDAAHRHLNQLQQKIIRLRSFLTKGASRQTIAQRQLEYSEVAGGHLAEKITHTRHELRYARGELSRLRKKAMTLQAVLVKRQQYLATQLRQIYYLGHPSYLQIILDRQDHAQTMRMMTYYQVWQAAQQKAIVHVRESLSEVAQNRRQMKHQLRRLQMLNHKFSVQHGDRTHLLRQRAAALSLLSRQMRTGRGKLTLLQSQRDQLQHTLLQLKNNRREREDFSKLRHHLSWPVSGRLISRYGTPLAGQVQMKQDGVVLAAKQGQPVHAVASGKVVFARWMMGYGLLMIIDHGHGYMTLYGRNETLNKQVGDQVRQGEVIAKAGESGGFAQTSLYFAIRHLTQSINPERWMHRKASA